MGYNIYEHIKHFYVNNYVWTYDCAPSKNAYENEI